jgi:hypothetical protein
MFWRFMNVMASLGLVAVIIGGVTLLPAYFLEYSLGAEGAMSWMLWVGLPLTAIDVLLVVALVRANSGKKTKTAALEDRGVLALAQITGVTPVGPGDQQFVQADLHIAGPGFAFDVHRLLRVLLHQQASFNARKLVVLVDPTAHDYTIDWQRSDVVNGVVPAQFFIAEDNKTYDLTGQVVPLMEILQILRANNIPFNSTVDLGSNPAVRQQALEVLRRPAAQPASTAQPVPVATSSVLAAPAPTVAQRLIELETLHAGGTISDAEYTTRRQQIIAGI